VPAIRVFIVVFLQLFVKNQNFSIFFQKTVDDHGLYQINL